jgi:hypothetical protein
MRWRLLLVLPALALPPAIARCPWIGRDLAPWIGRDLARLVATPEPAPPPAPPPSPPAAAPPAPPPPVVPSAPAPADPALAPTVPPELVDDGSDALPDPDPAPPRGPEVPELASTARETWVYAEPHWKARRIGYLRAGAIVERRSVPVQRNHACPEGWYRIEPRGYVCVGATATLDRWDPVVEASAKRPKLDGLPYTYVMSRAPAPPLYARLPSEEEATRVEPDLRGHLRRAAQALIDPAYVAPPPAEPVPGVLLYGRYAPALGDAPRRSARTLTVGTAKPRSGFALLSTFDYEGRRYGLTTELAVIPLDRTRVVQPSAFAGIALDDEVTLPVAFVLRRHAVRYVVGPGGLTRGAPLAFREAVPIAPGERRIGGTAYVTARDGTLLAADQVVRVDRPDHMPAWAAGGRRWIDVSILRQSLVAYEGKKPVYVTLVSTGADGLGDPKKTHSTIQGAFLVHTKHVTVTMGDRIGDEFDFRDVPFVQYFTEGFALHAAYWHDDFGTPRSHGCVNLSPKDAAWLFAWTGPEVPPGWHGALSLRNGTLVHTHP